MVSLGFPHPTRRRCPHEVSPLPFAAMNLEPIASLQPSFDPDRRLLMLNLDHGKANEMGSAELRVFRSLCNLIETSDEIRCLCTMSERFSARGKPIFIAGANVTERRDWDDNRIKSHVRDQRALMLRLRRLPVFNIVLSHGVTLGWGTEYLLTADYSLATSTASFALPETGLGIVPGARGSVELATLVGLGHAMRLGCTGEAIDATEAARIGLVQEMVADLGAGLARVHALAELTATRSPTALAAFKHAALDACGETTARRLEIEARAYEACVEHGDAAVGRASFDRIRKGEPPRWPAR
ncbi:MAG: enoyl-CoA hydratase/isomerase family protein [Myxococcales bacterium FL481]|nr:MAG: enoyl-CoA hydratase/isomerase family protein [Myxococcales bacterium FL481]